MNYINIQWIRFYWKTFVGLTGWWGLHGFAHPLIGIASFSLRWKLAHRNVFRWWRQHRWSRPVHGIIIWRAVGNLSRGWTAHRCRNSVWRSQAVGAPVLSRCAVRRAPCSRWLRVCVHVGHMMVSCKIWILWCGDKILWWKTDSRSSHGSLVIHASLFIQKVSNVHDSKETPKITFLRQHASHTSSQISLKTKAWLNTIYLKCGSPKWSPGHAT